jgi:hypothetical protein
MTVATVCVCGGAALGKLVEVLRWDSVDDARAALSELMSVPCSPRCKMHHLVVVHDGDQWHTAGPPEPPPPPMAEALAQCYPRSWADRSPETWPLDPMNNEPLSGPQPANGLRDRMRNGERLALRQGLAL